MKEVNYNETENDTMPDSRYPKLTPGGYVAVITKVTDCPVGYNEKKPDSGDFLRIEFDIESGDLAGYYTRLQTKFGFWGGTFFRSYKPSCAGMFKKFISTVQKSNPDLAWNWNGSNDEKMLEGKRIGVILEPETYTTLDGRIKEKMRVKKVVTVDEIESGNYTNPEPVMVVSAKSPDTMENITADVPF